MDMKENYIRFITFFGLGLLLAVGLTYLSLSYLTTAEDQQRPDTLAVALVNEDNGVVFNEQKLDFGDAFVRSLDKNDEQKWYVVSRGVAESGLERGAYEMMIIIPTDFSEKALSMEQENPEQVILDYKINASKSKNVQAQAEEMVSTILNDFNRRIIDVYFASVIGNLHNAQDRISELVEEEATHTNLYNQHIHNPLDGYVSQFENVKDNSSSSIDVFSSFEEFLIDIGDGLQDGIDAKTEYESAVNETTNLMDTNTGIRTQFLDDLINYDGHLNDPEVEKQLESLIAANSFIHHQFSNDEDGDDEDESSNILLKSQELKSRLQQSLDKVEETYQNIEEAMESGFVNEQIEKKLHDIIYSAFDGEDDLSGLLKSQDENMRKKIKKQIANLPTLDETLIGESALSYATKREINNVIRVTKAYNEDDEFDAVDVEDKDIVTDYVDDLINHLQENGIVMSDTVKIPENKNDKQIFQLHDLPANFDIDSLRIHLPGTTNAHEFTGDVAKGEIELQGNEAGDFKVELSLKLKDDNFNLDNFDLYNEIINWRWTLEQLDRTDKQSSSGTSSQRTDTSSQLHDLLSNANEEEIDEEAKDSEKDDKQEEIDEEAIDSEKNDKQEKQENHEENEAENEAKTNENKDDKSREEKKQDEITISSLEELQALQDDDTVEVEIYHNRIQHQVMGPVIDDSTVDLIRFVERTLNPYQKLLSMYEMYFGFDLTCERWSCREFSIPDDKDLTEHITDTSLYYLFNEEDIRDLLADYILHKIKDDVKESINEPITALLERLDSYRSFVKKTSKNADSLAEKVSEAQIEAIRLNDNLRETLTDINEWRDKSYQLLNTNHEIQSKNEEEKSAVISLESGLKPLLAQSQSLVGQAEGTLSSTENVYNIFNRVDEQANEIQNSGINLINQAEDLSISMTDKLAKDEAYVENFSKVLSNSRIGSRPNEDLYDFLSNPVTTENRGLITKSDTFTPYFLILISFIVALFSSYVISTLTRDNTIKNKFKEEDSLVKGNALFTGIIACVGIIEGLIIGLLSAYFIGINHLNMIGWTALMIVIMLVLLLISTYLLRQLKMIGMFVLLVILSLYLLFTKALGSGLSSSSNLRLYSPLQYLENMMTSAIRGVFDYPVTLIVVISFIVIGFLANLFVTHKSGEAKVKGDESA